MNNWKRFITASGSVCTFLVWICLLSATPGMAGELQPPGPPGSTMNSLSEIYEKVELLTSGVTSIPKTGQGTSHHAGDDGDHEKGMPSPIPRFIDNGNETVTDAMTDLVWTKNAVMFDKKPWSDALDCCSGLKNGDNGLSDGSNAGDWRLPNCRELQSLIDYGTYDPPLPGAHPFDSVPNSSAMYWTSTTFAFMPSAAWVISMNYGYLYYDEKEEEYYVWCVRDKQ